MRLRIGHLLPLLPALLAGCETAPQAQRPAAPPPSAAALAARLPAEAAGFQRGATTTLPGDGRETGYRTTGRTAAGATVEITRPGEAALPEGTDSPDAAAAFARLVEEATRPAPQRRLRAETRFALPEGASPALQCVETSGAYGRERVRGLLCAGGVSGGILRLRVTMPQRDPAPADPRAFALAILDALRTP
ncbi:hypothetical protein JMJ55_09460 [Belnapia sp. T6]|uniref:Lipoprotein n=1 Tax=Belnapia mucosa TaxID=2804532 RepID=A0ABS1V1H8_9PROT|nr:hypothetical protein [Belnapia mucosa]MBL6455548.1 hypothetical protein [Belnapia mucosa]